MSFVYSMGACPDSWPVKPPRQRRTATSVLAGDFDPRPTRDALSSLLNRGLTDAEAAKTIADMTIATAAAASMTSSSKKRDPEERESGRKEKKKKARLEKGKGRAIDAPVDELNSSSTNHLLSNGPNGSGRKELQGAASAASVIRAPTPQRAHKFWGSRPAVQLMDTRWMSVTPPLSTPGRSPSETTSPTSVSRPYTPGVADGLDVDVIDLTSASAPPAPMIPREKKKRVAARKGWKGWVEVDEEEEPKRDKLINLDEAPVITGERKLRSGKEL